MSINVVEQVSSQKWREIVKAIKNKRFPVKQNSMNTFCILIQSRKTDQKFQIKSTRYHQLQNWLNGSCQSQQNRGKFRKEWKKPKGQLSKKSILLKVFWQCSGGFYRDFIV